MPDFEGMAKRPVPVDPQPGTRLEPVAMRPSKPCRLPGAARQAGEEFRQPIRTPVYDKTITVLKAAVRKAKLGRKEELAALKRLDDRARHLEHYVKGPSLKSILAEERRRSAEYGGRSVFAWEKRDGLDAA